LAKVLLLFATILFIVVARSAYFFKSVENCFAEKGGAYRIDYNSMERGVNLANIQVHPEFLTKYKFGKLVSGWFSKVKQIWTTSPSIESVIAISKLPHLEVLGVSGPTLFDKEDSNHLKNFSLIALSLESTGITDSRFCEMISSGTIEGLSLVDERELTPISLDCISSLDNLESLGISSLPGLTAESLCSTICQLKRLQFIRLYYPPPLSDECFECFSRNVDLETLLLMDTNISDQGLMHIANCKNLEILVLRGGQFSIEGLKSLTGLQQLKHLKVAGVSISEPDIESLQKALPNCKVSVQIEPPSETQ